MVISWMFHGLLMFGFHISPQYVFQRPYFFHPGGGDGQEGAFSLRIQSWHEGGWMRWGMAIFHGETYGKDREHPLKARDFHIYVSLHGPELFILNYLVRALVQTQFLRSDGMQIGLHQKVEASIQHPDSDIHLNSQGFGTSPWWKISTAVK